MPSLVGSEMCIRDRISMAELSDKLKLLLAGNARGRYVLSMSS